MRKVLPAQLHAEICLFGCEMTHLPVASLVGKT